MGNCSLSIKDSGIRFGAIGYRTLRYRTLALRAIGYRIWVIGRPEGLLGIGRADGAMGDWAMRLLGERR